MKKNFFFAAVAFAMISVSFTSCKKNECIECNGVIGICEDEYKESAAANTIPWSTYKASATLAPGCSVVDGE